MSRSRARRSEPDRQFLLQEIRCPFLETSEHATRIQVEKDRAELDVQFKRIVAMQAEIDASHCDDTWKLGPVGDQ